MTPERREQVMRLHRQVPVIDCHNDSIQAILRGDTRFNPLRHRPPMPRRLWEQGHSPATGTSPGRSRPVRAVR